MPNGILLRPCLQSDIRLVCDDGCHPISDALVGSCSFAMAPFTALVGRNGWDSTTNGSVVLDYLTDLDEYDFYWSEWGTGLASNCEVMWGIYRSLVGGPRIALILQVILE